VKHNAIGLDRPAARHQLEVQAKKPIRVNVVPPQRTKLVFLIRSLGVGGAERQLVELAKQLASKSFDVTVVCFYSEGAFTTDLSSVGIPVISLHKRGRWEILRFLLRLARELRRQHPDILHAYLTGPNVLAVLMKPILSTTRIVWGVRATKVEGEGLVNGILGRLEALLSWKTSLIIVNSWAGLAHCSSIGFAKTRCVVVPNGIDIARFSPNREAGAKQRAHWGIPSASLLIGLIGRLDPMKDHATFLSAAAILAKSRPDARFVCIGGGSDAYLFRLQAIAQKLNIADRVLWTGIVKNMPAAYRALDICCSSSAFGEGTPNCVAEAMASGIPCVVTDVGDSRLLVGETGIVVPHGDPIALAAGLEQVALRIAREPELGRAARDRIVAGFSLPKLVDATSDALRAL
jgi:glycosyltransferase involved in cell wall biosynthesis